MDRGTITTMNIDDHIRVIKNFPKSGINFYDLGSLMANAEAWKSAVSQMGEKLGRYDVDFIMGIESRGFLLAAPLAYELNIGFGMIRKSGKLPGQTVTHAYETEYGKDKIEIQLDLVPKGAKVAIIDDLLATGGTMGASEKLINKLGCEVALCLTLIELEGLGGRAKLSAPFETILKKSA